MHIIIFGIIYVLRFDKNIIYIIINNKPKLIKLREVNYDK